MSSDAIYQKFVDVLTNFGYPVSDFYHSSFLETTPFNNNTNGWCRVIANSVDDTKQQRTRGRIRLVQRFTIEIFQGASPYGGTSEMVSAMGSIGTFRALFLDSTSSFSADLGMDTHLEFISGNVNRVGNSIKTSIIIEATWTQEYS